MIDHLIWEITEPEADASAAAKSAARERLLVAAETEGRRAPRGRVPLGRRGLATIVALLAVPTGVAVATELGRDGEQTFPGVADCPELLAEVEQRGLNTEGLLLAHCPVGAEVDQTLWLLAKLERQRAEIGGDEEAIGVIGGSPGEKSWSLEGITGTTKEEQP